MEEGSLVSVSYAVLSHLNFHHFSISADQICSSLGMQICCFSSCLPREQKSPKSFPAGLKNMPLVSELNSVESHSTCLGFWVGIW